MKSIRILSFWVVLIILLFPGYQTAKGAIRLYEDHNNGTITINYDNVNNAKMKIGITKGNTSYYYNLQNGENSIDIPLTAGNGTYKISVYRNIVGTKYCIVASDEYSLNIKDSDEVYLHPNVIVNYKTDYKAIIKANKLTRKCKSEEDKIKILYQYVIDDYLYDYNKYVTLKSGYIPDLQLIYELKKGICYDISALVAAMLRSQGINTKLVTGYTKNIPAYHAWNMIYNKDEKKWITIDATYDICKIAAGEKSTMIKNSSDYSDIIYQY